MTPQKTYLHYLHFGYEKGAVIKTIDKTLL